MILWLNLIIDTINDYFIFSKKYILSFCRVSKNSNKRKWLDYNQ